MPYSVCGKGKVPIVLTELENPIPILAEASKFLFHGLTPICFLSVINQNERESVSIIWAINVERFQCSLRISEISQGHNGNPLCRTEIHFF